MEQVPFSAADAYNKNIRIQFGRCPVRAVFPEALELLKKKSHLLGYVLDLLVEGIGMSDNTYNATYYRFMADKIMSITEAEEAYDIFNKMQVQKVIFRL